MVEGAVHARIRGAARWALGAVVDLLYPPRCAACDADLEDGAADRLCPACERGIARLPNPCPRCASPRAATAAGSRCRACRSWRPGFRGVVAAMGYPGTASKLVLRLKYAGERWQAFGLGERLGRAVAAAPFAADVDAVLPIPLARDRRRERGYNQAALLAAEAARTIRRPMREGWLRRTGTTLSQEGLSRAARRRNVKGRFRVRARRVRGKTVLLVDDVLTTGATLSEAARALRRAGAKAVYAAVVARA